MNTARRTSTLLLVLTCLGCTATDPEGRSVPDAPVETGVLAIDNSSGQTIFSLRFAGRGDVEWGTDRLSGGDVIKRGQRTSHELPVGTYKVRAELGDGRVIEASESYTVRSGEESVCVISAAGAERVGTLTLVNDTGFAIAQVAFSLTSEMGWGSDRLDLDEVLGPGKSRSWKVPAGRYNLRVQFQDGTALEGGSAYEVVAGERAIYRLRN